MDAERRQQRAGRITASRMHDVMALGEGGVFKSGPRKGQARPPSAARQAYIHQLATERITGIPTDEVTAAAMEWGKQWEPVAIEAYEIAEGVITTPCGLVLHPLYDFIAASPDFLEGGDAGGEVKCPYNREVHARTLLEGLPPEHIEQIQGGLWCTGRQRWTFLSFHPMFPPGLQLYRQVIERDETYIAGLEAACLSLEAEVRKAVERLNFGNDPYRAVVQ